MVLVISFGYHKHFHRFHFVYTMHFPGNPFAFNCQSSAKRVTALLIYLNFKILKEWYQTLDAATGLLSIFSDVELMHLYIT